MTVFKRIIDNDPGRAAMRAARLAISQRAATQPKLQNLLPDVTGDDPNKLPKSHQGADNDVVIDQVLDITPPPPPGRPVSLQLLWDGVPVGDVVETTTPVDSQQTLVLPGIETTAPGPHRLSYRLIYSGTAYDYDSPVTINIDKEAPNKAIAGAEVKLPPEYADNRITKERLDADPNIVVTIPLHSDRKEGDVADLYLGISNPGTLIGSYIAPDDSNSAMTITLTKVHVESSGEGPRILYYKMRDRVGNEGPASHELQVTVELSAAPSNLKPLVALEAPDPDHLIDLKDAVDGTGVQINPYDNVGPLDEIALIWDSISQGRRRASDGLPMIIDVSYADLKRNGLGPRAVSASYSVWRGTQQYTETTVVPINVDLRRAGPLPPDPEDPDIGNPNLSPVTVKAKNTTDPNKFELIDAGEDGTATTTISNTRATGDVYKLYWNKVPVPAPGGEYTVTGNEADGDPVAFTIPGAFITAQGNAAAHPVHYEVSNPTLPDGNVNPSLRQPVSVYVISVTLPEVKIANLYVQAGIEFLNCSSLRVISNVGWAAVVDVKGGPPLARDMELEFTWVGNGYDGTGPVPVPDYVFNKRLSGNEHVDGTTVYLPHDAALLPIKDGDGAIRYKVTVDGRDTTSNEHKVQVVVRDGDGNNCPLP